MALEPIKLEDLAKKNQESQQRREQEKKEGKTE
jgi:hypothetical protein